jgi:hypothetical protein
MHRDVNHERGKQKSEYSVALHLEDTDLRSERRPLSASDIADREHHEQEKPAFHLSVSIVVTPQLCAG